MNKTILLTIIGILIVSLIVMPSSTYGMGLNSGNRNSTEYTTAYVFTTISACISIFCLGIILYHVYTIKPSF